MDDEKTRRRFLLLLLVAALLLLAFLIEPLASALLTAAVFAGVLWPLQLRLTRRVRKPSLAASILVFAMVIVVVGPILGMSAFVVDEGSKGIKFVATTVQSQGLGGLIEKLPPPVRGPAHDLMHQIERHTGADVSKTVTEQVQSRAAGAAAGVGRAVAATWGFVFNATMMLIALFFLLVQGRQLVAWLDNVLPLREGQTRELLTEFKKVSYAVLVATVVTAAAQAIAALLGYLIASVPHPIFFAAITFFGAFIPAIGAAAFSLFAALILLVTGHQYMAIFLAIWSVTVVALIDNVIKPLVAKGGMDMPGAVVFFALIGGLGAFGPIGLMLGPLSVAFFVAVLRIYRREVSGEPVVVEGA
ncbi:MAG TPA: AI-2E family transporter [Polyangiales bacterium]|nr:AI-2E family transporter [Polyangiales bacterium]